MLFLVRSIGAGIIVLTVAIAGADFYFKERHRLPEELGAAGYETLSSSDASVPEVVTDPGTSSSDAGASSLPAGSSSSRAAVKKGTSTRKQSSVNVEEVFAKLGLIATETRELSLIGVTAPDAGAKTTVLLKDDDRAFLFSWIEHDDAKTIFYGLKTALQEQFSADVHDLVDETRTSTDGPPVDILSFMDPAISKEKLYFLRVRNRLYEIHVAENGAAILEQLIAELSR